MPVNTPHECYTDMSAEWQRVRDALAGEHTVKSKGELHLHRPGGQIQDDYQLYKRKAEFPEITSRTRDALSGMVMRHAPQMMVPDALTPIIDDVTLAGDTLLDAAEESIDEVLAVGRYGVLVDYSANLSNQPRTIAEIERIGARPYIIPFRAEDCIGWRVQQFGARRDFSMLVFEQAENAPDATDSFLTVETKRYLHLYLDDDRGAAVYRQQWWEWDTKQAKAVRMGEPITPLINGMPLRQIPFVPFPDIRAFCEATPGYLSKIASQNYHIYGYSADLGWALHFCGLPTMVISDDDRSGIGADGAVETKTYTIGSSQPIVLSANGRAEWLALDSSKFDALQKKINNHLQNASVLGAEFLQGEKAGVEAAATVRMRREGEYASLTKLSNALSERWENVLRWLAIWSDLPTRDISYQLNRDYVADHVDPQQLASWMQLYTLGVISKQTLYERAQSAEIANAARDFEEEQALIAEESDAELPILTAD